MSVELLDIKFAKLNSTRWGGDLNCKWSSKPHVDLHIVYPKNEFWSYLTRTVRIYFKNLICNLFLKITDNGFFIYQRHRPWATSIHFCFSFLCLFSLWSINAWVISVIQPLMNSFISLKEYKLSQICPFQPKNNSWQNGRRKKQYHCWYLILWRFLSFHQSGLNILWCKATWSIPQRKHITLQQISYLL